MSETPTDFELVEFEHVEAAPGTALLRIAGRPSSSTPPGPLTLIISDGQHEFRHPQLPALPGPPGLLRAAFSAPVDHVGRGVLFSLELAGGGIVRLPAPSRRRAGGGHLPGAGGGSVAGALPSPSAARAEAESSRLAEAERRAEARRLAITELERRLQAERERRHAAESDIARLRADRDQAFADRDEALANRDEAVADRDQAEARARVAAGNAGTLEAQVRAAADAAGRVEATMQAQIDDKAAEVERVRAAAELAQARAHASRREVAELDEQFAHAQAQITVLEKALEERGAEAKGVSAEADAAIAAARSELVESQSRVTALEQQLESLHDLAQRTESQHTYDLETTQARMDVAHAELEVARAEQETAQHRIGVLEATLAELDAVLGARLAEIDLLRGAVVAAQADVAADVATRTSEQLEMVAAAAGAEAALATEAQVQLLLEQTAAERALRTEAEQALEDANSRASAAESALAERTAELDEFGTRVREQIELVNQSRSELVETAEQNQAKFDEERQRADDLEVELQRIRDAAALISAELLTAGEAVEQAKTESAAHQRRAAELSDSLTSAQRTMREATEAIAGYERKHQELSDSVRAETERRVRAEEALLAASAESLIVSESLALEATARTDIEVKAERLSSEHKQLAAQAETLFAELAQERDRSAAQADVLRELK